MSMTARCSTWFFVLATRLGGELGVESEVAVRGAVPASGCDVTAAVDGDQQLRRGAEEPVDGEPVARAERRLEPVEHAVAIDRAVAVTAISRAITAFVSRPARTASAGGGDGGEVRRRRRDLLDRGSSRRPAAADRRGERRRLGRHRRRCDPAAAVGRLAHGDGGITISPGSPGSNGTQPMATGVRARAAPSSWSIDASSAGASSTGDATRRRDRRSRRRRARRVAVVSGDVVEVEARHGVVGERGDGAHRSRVPVSSWVMPPLSWWCAASSEPGPRSMATISSGGGR